MSFNSNNMDTSILYIEKLMQANALWQYNNSGLHVQTAKSGLHSDSYLNTDIVVSNPQLVEEIIKNVFCKELNIRNIKPDWIVTYPPEGIALAYAFARQIGAKMAYIDPKTEECNFEIREGDSVVVIGDDIYSGGSIKKAIMTLRGLEAKIEGPLLSIGNFSGTESLLGVEIVSAISQKGNLYDKNDCPMCKEGSKAVLPRPNWNALLKIK